MGYWQNESEIKKVGCFKVPIAELGLSRARRTKSGRKEW